MVLFFGPLLITPGQSYLVVQCSVCANLVLYHVSSTLACPHGHDNFSILYFLLQVFQSWGKFLYPPFLPLLIFVSFVYWCFVYQGQSYPYPAQVAKSATVIASAENTFLFHCRHLLTVNFLVNEILRICRAIRILAIRTLHSVVGKGRESYPRSKRGLWLGSGTCGMAPGFPAGLSLGSTM